MRPAVLLTAIFAGCLNLAALVEAHDRHGQGGPQGRGSVHPSFGQHSFSHRSFGHHSFQHRWFAGRSAFGPARHPQRFADFAAPRWFGPSAGMWRVAPWHSTPHFAFGQPRSAFGFRQPMQRFVGPVRLPPLTVLRGTGIPTGRPFVAPHARLFNPFVTARSHRFPTFVGAFPGPRFGFRHDGFGSPHRRDGLVIVLRDPARGSRW
jgi:hypothetical protein